MVSPSSSSSPDIVERIRIVAIYNAIVFGIFLALYYALGFTGEHFIVSDKANVPPWFGPVWYSVQTHGRIAYGDVVSGSQTVRVLTCAHILLSYFSVVLFALL